MYYIGPPTGRLWGLSVRELEWIRSVSCNSVLIFNYCEISQNISSHSVVRLTAFNFQHIIITYSHEKREIVNHISLYFILQLCSADGATSIIKGHKFNVFGFTCILLSPGMLQLFLFLIIIVSPISIITSWQFVW